MASAIPIDSYDLRVYTIVQASFLFCLLLSAVFAVLSARPALVFTILSVNSLVHLLLDSLEKKWGNGVHLFAPFDWTILSFDWIWPDSQTVAVLSIVSLFLVLYWLLRRSKEPVALRFTLAKLALCIPLVMTYLLLPLILKSGPYEQDINSVSTLAEKTSRNGKLLYMDREPYVRDNSGDYVITFAGEHLQVVGELQASRSAEVTLIAEFIDEQSIRILQLYEYDVAWRGYATMLGLILVVFFWCVSLWREYRLLSGYQ